MRSTLRIRAERVPESMHPMFWNICAQMCISFGVRARRMGHRDPLSGTSTLTCLLPAKSGRQAEEMRRWAMRVTANYITWRDLPSIRIDTFPGSMRSVARYAV